MGRFQVAAPDLAADDDEQMGHSEWMNLLRFMSSVSESTGDLNTYLGHEWRGANIREGRVMGLVESGEDAASWFIDGVADLWMSATQMISRGQ